ncbi:MAG TPA: hypothetical protein VHS09_12415 [Polyangiaceae bacterium]|jgi:hypothetical protein|nr:hypothetical protein [Polyangiaceae bacterium]
MTGELAHITRCMDLAEVDIVRAIVDREHTKALLAHLASRSSPNTGVAKALLVLARMATTACDWIDGDLAIELTAANGTTRIDVATDLGGGLKERVFATLVFQALLEEFSRAIERVPHMVAPLRVGAKTPQRIALVATEATRRTSLPPPPIEIAPESLFVRLGTPALPHEKDDDATLGSLPVILAAPPAPPAPAPRAVTDPPPDLDSGWDD